MTNLFIAGVGNITLFRGTESVLISKTLIDSSINLSVSLEDIRAGAGAKLYGRYAHSSGMTMKLTDAMFRMEFLAANIGANVEIGGEAVATMHTRIKDGKVTLPMDVGKFYPEMEKPVVWLAEANGKNEFIPFEIEEDATELVGLPWTNGTRVCIRHIKPYEAGQTLKVSANFIPDTLTAVLTAPLFAGDQNDLEASTRIGTLTITIPRFMLNGTTDLTMSMTGVTQSSLEGIALVTEDVACDGEGYYAIISKVIMTGNWHDGLIALVVENEEQLSEGDKIKVYGKYPGAIVKLNEDKYTIIPSLIDGKVVNGAEYRIYVEAGKKIITKKILVGDTFVPEESNEFVFDEFVERGKYSGINYTYANDSSENLYEYVGEDEYLYYNIYIPYDNDYLFSYKTTMVGSIVVRFFDCNLNNISSDIINIIDEGVYVERINGILKQGSEIVIPYKEGTEIAYFKIGFQADENSYFTDMCLQKKK